MIFHALTAVLVVLKLLGHIDISWLLVVLPSFIGFIMIFLILLSAFVLSLIVSK